MSAVNERLTVNAAIETLIARDDMDGTAVQTVIAYGSRLKKSKKFAFIHSKNTTSSGDSVSGFSPDHGEISIKDKERTEHKVREFGIYKDRVGYYRLWKEYEGVLRFHHFWKSDLTTKGLDGSEPDVYHIGYNPETLEMTYFAIERRKIRSITIFGTRIEFSKHYLERIQGDGKLPDIGGSVGVFSSSE